MKRFAGFGLAVFCCVCVMVATEQRAHAYVNPGDGLMVIQGAASALAAAGYMFRRKIMALFGKSEKAEVAVKATVPAKRTTSRLA